MAERATPLVALPPKVEPSHESSDIRTLIYDNGITRIEHVSGASPAPRLAVSFAHYGMLDVGGKGYAEDFLRDRGFDVVAVKCNRNNWFQDLSREVMRDLIAELPDYADIVTYGSSMGGYAALYFGGCMEARTCIAISPQFSIDPALPPHEQRWAGDAPTIDFHHLPLDQVLDRDAAAAPATKWYVLYDPLTRDTAHVALMQAAAPRNIVPVSAPYSGHPSGFMLAECGALSGIFDKIIDGVLPDVRSMVAGTKAQSVSYLFTLAQACDARGHRAAARGLFDRAVELSDRSDIVLEYSRFLYRTAEYDLALVQLERAWPLLYRDSHLLAYKAHLQHVTGQEKLARGTFEQAIQLQPDFVAFYQSERHLFQSMLEKQDIRIRLLETALSRARDELAVKRGPVAGKFDLNQVARMILTPLAIAGGIFLFVRFLGIY